MLPESNFGEVEEFESSHWEFIGKAVLMAFGFGHSLGRAVTMMSVASESRLQFCNVSEEGKSLIISIVPLKHQHVIVVD